MSIVPQIQCSVYCNTVHSPEGLLQLKIRTKIFVFFLLSLSKYMFWLLFDNFSCAMYFDVSFPSVRMTHFPLFSLQKLNDYFSLTNKAERKKESSNNFIYSTSIGTYTTTHIQSISIDIKNWAFTCTPVKWRILNILYNSVPTKVTVNGTGGES